MMSHAGLHFLDDLLACFAASLRRRGVAWVDKRLEVAGVAWRREHNYSCFLFLAVLLLCWVSSRTHKIIIFLRCRYQKPPSPSVRNGNENSNNSCTTSVANQTRKKTSTTLFKNTFGEQ